jgi:hypothetical protein
MGAVFVDQGDERALTAAVGMTQAGGKFQTTRAAAHNDYFVLFAHLQSPISGSQAPNGNLNAIKRLSMNIIVWGD